MAGDEGPVRSRSGDPLEKGGDSAGPRSLGDPGRSRTIGAYHSRSGDPDGKSRAGDTCPVGCRSGNPLAIVGDPVELGWRGDPG